MQQMLSIGTILLAQAKKCEIGNAGWAAHCLMLFSGGTYVSLKDFSVFLWRLETAILAASYDKEAIGVNLFAWGVEQ